MGWGEFSAGKGRQGTALSSPKYWMDGLLGIPGGHPFPGESPMIAAVREITEELGLVVAVERLRFLCAYSRLAPDNIEREKLAIEFVVELGAHEKLVNAEPEKCSELVWCDPNALPTDVIDEFRGVIARYAQGDTDYFEYGYTT